jgi:tetratricopeptide (TPR) repeat protein
MAMGSFERAEILVQIAEVYEMQPDKKARALRILGKALAEDPSNELILQKIAWLAHDLNAYEELVVLVAEIFEQELSEEALWTLGLQLADWYLSQLHDLARAEKTYQRILHVVPHCLATLDGLELIYRLTGETAKLAGILRRKAELTLVAKEKRDYLVTVAHLLEERLADDAGASDAWQAVLELDAADKEALDALATIYQRQAAWEPLLKILDRQAALAQQVQEEVRLKLRAGEVLVRYLGDNRRAAAVYREILWEIQPGEKQAFEALQSIYTHQANWNSLCELFSWQLEHPLDLKQRIMLYHQLAKLCVHRLQHFDEGVHYYRMIFFFDSQLLDPTIYLEILDEFEPLLQKKELWADLVAVHCRHAGLLARQEKISEEGAQWILAANLWNDKLNNPKAAIEIIKMFLQQHPFHVQALTCLARLYYCTAQWGSCKEVLSQAESLERTPQEAAEIEYRLGRLVQAQAQDERKAALHYARALKSDRYHLKAAMALEAFCRVEGEWDSVAHLLELRLMGQRDSNKTSGPIFESTTEPSNALGLNAQLLKAQDIPLWASLAEAYCAANKLEQAESLLHCLMALEAEPQQKNVARYIFLLGKIEEKRGDTAQAQSHYVKAYQMDCSYEPLLISLVRIYLEQQDWENARKVYRSMLLQYSEQSSNLSKADILSSLGKIQRALDKMSRVKRLLKLELSAGLPHLDIGPILAECNE